MVSLAKKITGNTLLTLVLQQKMLFSIGRSAVSESYLRSFVAYALALVSGKIVNPLLAKIWHLAYCLLLNNFSGSKISAGVIAIILHSSYSRQCVVFKLLLQSV